MKINRNIAIMLLPMLAPLTLAAADYYSCGFNSIPGAFTVKDGDGKALNSEYYLHIDIAKTWTVAQIGSHGYAAVSMSHTGDGSQQDNWLISPAVTVNSADARVTWESRSLMPELPESYKVMVSTDNGETFTEIFSSAAEPATWNTRSISLAKYVGSDVKVAFVCNSADKFMLAIDNLEIGVPKEVKFFAVNHTPHFCTDAATTPVSLSLTNVGKALDGSVYVTVDGSVVDEADFTSASGDTDNVVLNVPVSLNNATEYSVYVKDADGNSNAVCSDKIMCSYFTRRILVDKGTGTWCVNCPTADVLLQHLQEKYGDEIIPVSTHTGDIMVQGGYFSNLGFNAVPMFLINRNRSTISSTNAFFDTEFATPVLADINAEFAQSADRQLSVTAKVKFAEDVDNSADKYRVAYTFTREYYAADDPYYDQSNSTLTSSGEQYYFMPSYINCDMMYYKHVSVDNTAAFTGVAGSLPASIAAGDEYTATFNVKVPGEIESFDNGDIVLFVLNTETGYVYNATSLALTANSGVNTVVADKVAKDNAVYNLMGVKVGTDTSNLPAGIYVSSGKKIVIR